MEVIFIKNKTVCFTGHRIIPVKDQEKLELYLKQILIELIEKGYCYFGAGGALGFDTVAALIVLRLKEIYTHIRLILVLPCKSQANSWKEKDKQVYEWIKSQADKVVYTSGDYTKGCMHKRNRHLVDNSSVCVCYLTESKGGTYYTVGYARSKNCKVINTADNLD